MATQTLNENTPPTDSGQWEGSRRRDMNTSRAPPHFLKSWRGI